MRTAHPTCAPVRSVTAAFTFTFGSTFAHMLATRSSTTDDLEQAEVEHLHHVFVFERVRHRDDVDRTFPPPS